MTRKQSQLDWLIHRSFFFFLTTPSQAERQMTRKQSQLDWLIHRSFFFFFNHPIAPDSTDGHESSLTQKRLQHSPFHSGFSATSKEVGLGWGKGRAGIANYYYLLQPSMGLSGPDWPYEIPVVMTLAQNTPNRLRKRSRKARTGKSMTAPIATCRHGEGDENFAEDIHAKNPDYAGALTFSIWRLKPDILSNNPKSWQRNLMRFSWETNKIEKLSQHFLLFMSFWQKIMRISAGIRFSRDFVDVLDEILVVSLWGSHKLSLKPILSTYN